jgi:hypothetical protein
VCGVVNLDRAFTANTVNMAEARAPVPQLPHEFGQSFARCSKFYMFVNSFLQCVKPGDKKVLATAPKFLATAPKFLAFLVVQVHKRVSYDNSHYSRTQERVTTKQRTTFQETHFSKLE